MAQQNTAFGIGSLTSVVSGNYNVALGYQAGNALTTGIFNTAIGANAFLSGAIYNYSTAVGYNSQISGNNQIVIGTAAETATIPGFLKVGGNVTGGNLIGYALYVSSDYRLKDNVQPLTMNRTVDVLKPVEYDHVSTGRQMGFIAHELQEEYPFLVTGEKDGEDFQTVNYNGLIALLVKEIQDIKKRLDDANI